MALGRLRWNPASDSQRPQTQHSAARLDMMNCWGCSESQGGLPGAAAAPAGVSGAGTASNPIVGLPKSPWASSSCPAALGRRTCLAFRACGSCRMNWCKEKPGSGGIRNQKCELILGNQCCSHTPAPQQGLPVPCPGRFSISPQSWAPGTDQQHPTGKRPCASLLCVLLCFQGWAKSSNSVRKNKRALRHTNHF